MNFIIGFQNNAAYDRIWEARKIWGGIVNSSRTWGIMVNDFITNDHTKKIFTEEELKTIKQTLIYRHIGWITSLRYAMRAPKPWEHFLKYRTNRAWTERSNIREFKLTLEEELKPYLSPKEFIYLMKKRIKPHIQFLYNRSS